MEETKTTSTFPENENKIEVTSNNNSSLPKFEDIVDINNYNKKNIPKISHKKKFQRKKKLKFCCRKIGNTLSLLSDKYGNPLFMIGPHWPMYVFFLWRCLRGIYFFFYSFFY